MAILSGQCFAGAEQVASALLSSSPSLLWASLYPLTSHIHSKQHCQKQNELLHTHFKK
jgi:hypothetical protein